MSRTRRAASLSLLVAALVAPATSVAAAPAPDASTANLPGGCYAEFTATTPDREVAAVTIDEGEFDTATQPGARLPYVPRSMAFSHFVGAPDGDGTTWHYLAISPTGALDALATREFVTGGSHTWTTLPPTKVGRGWGGTRQLLATHGSGLSPYTYALTKNGLNRYRVVVGSESRPGLRGAGSVAAGGFGGVRHLTWARSTTGRAAADVLLGVAGNRLVEYTIPHASPTKVGVTVLRDRGWGAITRITSGICTSGGRTTAAVPLLGIVADGSVYGYVDKNGANGSGADIRGYGRLGSVGDLRVY